MSAPIFYSPSRVRIFSSNSKALAQNIRKLTAKLNMILVLLLRLLCESRFFATTINRCLSRLQHECSVSQRRSFSKLANKSVHRKVRPTTTRTMIKPKIMKKRVMWPLMKLTGRK